ncbi:protein FAM117B-like isoform X2 [Tachypleus tridentatus]|uniref:protein FAM117B-like isoform X2 n=1 Tax=Tachypleus tridentatus TaxID=6853 RepID=UPI003FD38ECA
MSNQTPQRVCKTGSPCVIVNVKHGPLKATVPVSFMRHSITVCNNTTTIDSTTVSSNINATYTSLSHSTSNKNTDGLKFQVGHSPGCRLGISVDQRSPGSPGFKEKSKTLNIKSISAAPYIRRTASLDTIYLAGQWPRDCYYHSYYVRDMMDRATQTDDWEEFDRKKGSQKKFPGNGGDQLEMKYIRQRLQRTNKSSHGPGGYSSYQRLSPFQGDHSAISQSTPAGSSNGSVPSTATTTTSTSFYQHLYNIPTHSGSTGAVSRSHTGPIPIPHIPKASIPRIRSSVEGLNQEIERLVLKGISGNDVGDVEFERDVEPPPDGHRAPIADLFRSTTAISTRNVNTQTPSGRGESCPNSGATSRSQSVSPIVSFLGQMDSSQPASREGSKSASPDLDCNFKFGTSPCINRFLAREPPDGCEKVKISEERRNTSTLMEPQGYGPFKPSEKFVLLPSQSSAFYPLYKNYVSPSTSDNALQQMTSSPHSLAEEKLQ